MNPDSQQRLRGQYAGFTTRAVALIVDVLIIVSVVAVVTASTSLILQFFNIGSLFYTSGSNPSPTTLGRVIILVTSGVTSLVMYIGYPVLFVFFSGQTIGKRLMGLRIVSMDGSRITAKRALIRTLGYWVSAIAFFLGFLWVLWDDQRRAWHDKVAGTCVVYYWDAQAGPLMRERMARRAAQQDEGQQAPKNRHAKA